jgi:hypothetical protein
MKHKAKTYLQFINEAYVDDSGELQDFNPPGEDDYEYQLLDHAQRIQEYLEESGAEEVQLSLFGGVIKFKFEYSGSNYTLMLDLDENSASLMFGRIPVYEDSADAFFDLLAAKGLEFLNY